jgi:hypothetical protein
MQETKGNHRFPKDRRPNQSRPNQTHTHDKPAFQVDSQVTVRLDLWLAVELGDFILSHFPENPAIRAVGHQLQNIIPPEKSDASE